MGKWFIDSVEIAGGFLAGLSLRFPRGLICVIGPRGSGKSTLAEAIRYAVAGTSGVSKPRLELIQANLASAALTMRTLGSDGEHAHTIKRIPDQAPVLLGTDDHTIASVDLDRGTFLPLDAYNNVEIEDIANETLGSLRRTLLDELRTGELQDIRFSLAQHRRELAGNADAIRAKRKLIADQTERIEEFGDVRARLDAMPALPEDDAAKRFAAVSRRRQVLMYELEIVRGRAKELLLLQEQLDLWSREWGAKLVQPLRTVESEFAELLLPVEERLRQSAGRFATLASQIAQEIAASEKVLTDVASKLEQALAQLDGVCVELQAKDQVASEKVRQRTVLEQAAARLGQIETERVQAISELKGFLEQRQSLKGAYLLERDRISDVREEVAESLRTDAGQKVRIRVIRNADSLSYKQILMEGLHGARVRNHGDIIQALMRLRPEQLAQIIYDADANELEIHTSIGHDRCSRVIDAFQQQIDPLELEVVEIDDRICIELNVSTADVPNYKDASELSRGQKCTALLPLLLARQETPLVIDQPEDNLDNHFIYETVVETVKRLKTKRQMIFITHNANIPVLGEADLVVVLNSDGKTGYIEKVGSLDDCRDEIIDLLEGGEEAFELRRKRYERG